jgi:hypothetical protein
VRNSGGEPRSRSKPALEELKRQAAQGEVVHNDDTSMRVLSLDRDTDISPERTGVFTSGLVWMVQQRRIALYFTGCKHAGENLAEVLKLRSGDLPPIIQMCDALSRNEPKIVQTLVANCNAHGRRPPARNFVGQCIGNILGGKCFEGGMHVQHKETRFRGVRRSPEGD